jgi:putative membrane protein
VASDASTQLALDRTRLAYERTMMAWIRTATSLISFGFSIYKFFDLQVQKQTHTSVIGPRRFALLMIGIGLASLALAAFQHHQNLTSLRGQYGHVPRSAAELVGILIAAMGMLAFVAVLLHL